MSTKTWYKVLVFTYPFTSSPPPPPLVPDFSGSILGRPSRCRCASIRPMCCALRRGVRSQLGSSCSRCPAERVLLPGRVRKLCVLLETGGVQLKTDRVELQCF